MNDRALWTRRWLALLTGLTVATSVVAGMPGRALGQEAGSTEGDRERPVMERFLTLLERAPRRGTALDRVYGYHVDRGTVDDLIGRYRDRTAQDPGDGAGWLLLGLFESQRGRDAEALAALRQAEVKRPDDPLPPYYLGQALVLIGQPDAAAEAFERALLRKPARADLLEVFQALGRVYQRAHRNEQALAVWGRLEALFPEDLRVQEQIAAALAEESQLDQALTRYDALARKTRDPYRQVQFRIEAADLKLRLGRSADALASFEAILAGLNPESWLDRELRRRIEDVFLRNDDQAGLASYYEHWLKKSPDDIEVMVRLARSLASQGRAAEARPWLDKAVKLAPSRKELRLTLIEQLVQEKKFAEAAAQYEAMSRSDPGNPDLIRDWGRLFLKDTSLPEGERKRRAAAVWRGLVAARPKDPAIAIQVADLFRQAEMTDEAIALYRKAVELAPDAAQYREYLGEYYHDLKRPDDALAAWRPIAAGANRDAKNLLRLAEVLAGFGYRGEAIAAVADATTLDPGAFEIRLKHADLLHDDQQFDAADAALDAAARVADDDEHREVVQERRIKNDAAAGKLEARIAGLREEIEDAGEEGEGVRARVAALWRRLALYLEAEQKLPEATAAIERAVAIDDRSVPAWTVAARLYEATGRLGDAADVARRLAGLDRRARTESLTSVARLEARLGRREQALKAGRDLMAAAPGNPEHAQFFADLCFQLGAADEGIETLRRAARTNASDPKALLSLADALSREFRTEEAIDLFWRAYEKTNDLDGKLGIVSRLAELYLQRNQFDRLVGRLERLRQQGDQPREAALCLAQAYAASGDLATARQEVERLLATNPRDTALLKQLSTLAENEGDLADAAKYQKQLNEVAPGDESAARLAQLYLRSGEIDEAEAIWSRLASDDQDASRILQAVDSLLANGKNESAIGITERMIRKDPGNWEALYREGRALSALGRTDDAAGRFRAVLDLRRDDDEEGAIVKARRKSPTGTGMRTAGTAATAPGSPTAATLPPFPARDRLYAANSIQMLLGMQQGSRFMQVNPWTPADFGQARMFALGWLSTQAQRDTTQAEWLARLRAARDQAPNDPRPARDWYYLQLLRPERPDTYEAARFLARLAPNDPSALWSFLSTLPARARLSTLPMVLPPVPVQAMQFTTTAVAVDRTPPLPAAELDEVLAFYHSLRRQKPEVVLSAIVTSVLNELKRAGRDEYADALYRDEVASARDARSISTAANLAAERGDVEAVLKLFDAFERLPGPRVATSSTSGLVLTTSGYVSGPASSLARVMRLRADAGAHADILKLLDRYLATLRNPNRASRGNTPSSGSGTPGSSMSTVIGGIGMGAVTSTTTTVTTSSPSYQVWLTGNSSRSTRIDYPTPDAHLDHASIQLLRNAFELFKRDDLLGDLVAHIGKPIEAGAPEGERLTAHLMLSALRWWTGEKDEALKELDRAVALAPADADLRLKLAEIRAQRQEFDEALTLLDSFEPLDQATMQRRELLALRLAVPVGDTERARKAAERLFGLRLDPAVQVELATQMQQLGMHELAEAVLARARRRAGNDSTTLVNLMRQYQGQGKGDVAEQVAFQILRRGPSSSRPGSPATKGEDVAHREAIQVLTKSGKLREIIERTEAQVARSPQSIPLHQTLVSYYRAAGQPDKVKAAIATMARLRLDDTRFQLQMASQLLQTGQAPGDAAAAVEIYRAALKKEPSLFANHYGEIQVAFQRAGKTDEMVGLIDGLDLKAMGNSFTVLNLVNMLMQNAKTQDKGMALFRKAWAAFPGDRRNFIVQLSSSSQAKLWEQPEIFDLACEVVIPVTPQSLSTPWQGIDQIYSWSTTNNTTKVTATVNQLLDAAGRNKRLDDVAGMVIRAREQHPEWLGGKAILGLIRVRQKRPDEARRELESLLAEKSMPADTRMLIGQEVETDDALRPVAVALYEGAIKDESTTDRFSGMGYQYKPARRLVALYRKDNRLAEARDLLLDDLRRRNDPNPMFSSSPESAAYQRLNELSLIGKELLELGFPADAVRVYNELIGSSEDLQLAQGMNGGTSDHYLKPAQDGLEKAMAGLNPGTLAATLETLLKPNTHADARGRGEAIDLALVVNPRTLSRAAMTSLLASALQLASTQPDLMKDVTTRLKGLAKDHPVDLGVQTVAALMAELMGETAALAEAAGRLEKLAEARPFEDLSEGARPSARQRAEAARQLPLWLVARACAKHDEVRAIGDRLASRAREAARRQSDPIWSLAMLRELGQDALDRGDRAAAEACWSEILDLVLASPVAPRPARQPDVLPTQEAVAAAPAPATRPRKNVPVVTLDRFEQAMQVASFAAVHDMHALSLRAVRESLKGGPPVMPMPMPSNRAGIVIGMTPTSSMGMTSTSTMGMMSPSGVGSNDPATMKVAGQLAEIDKLWEQKKAPAIEVYETLREVVLPAARPTELFPYQTVMTRRVPARTSPAVSPGAGSPAPPPPLPRGVGSPAPPPPAPPAPPSPASPAVPVSPAPTTVTVTPASPLPPGARMPTTVTRVQTGGVGMLLARRAVRAGQADDLRRRIEERQADPKATAAADGLLKQLATAENEGK